MTRNADITQSIVAAVMSKHRLVKAGQLYYSYDGRRYNLVGDESFDAKVRCAIMADRSARITERLVSQCRSAVTTLADRPNLMDGDFMRVGVRISTGEPAQLLPVANGLLDVNTRTLHPFDPDVFAPFGVAAAYDPAAPTSDWFLDMVDRVAGGCAARVEMIQELYGACLDPYASYGAFWVLVGHYYTGLESVLSPLVALTAESRSPSLSARCLLSRFRGVFNMHVGLLDSLVNIEKNQIRLRPNDAAGVSALAAKGALVYRFKFKKPFVSLHTTKHIFVVDRPPEVAAPGQQLIVFGETDCRRVRACQWEQAETWGSAMPGILNWSLTGLARLRSRVGVRPAQTHGRHSPLSAAV